MTKKEAFSLFKQMHPAGAFVSPVTGRIDRPARDQAWNDFTDSLCKEGRITAAQYSNWVHPFN